MKKIRASRADSASGAAMICGGVIVKLISHDDFAAAFGSEAPGVFHRSSPIIIPAAKKGPH